MRYDTSMIDGSTAHDILNNSSEFGLAQIFKKFGEERYPETLASAVVKARQGTIINTTGEFKEIIRKAFSGHLQDSNQSIKRAFQALRIATNYELANI